jgi:hypothetical protein
LAEAGGAVEVGGNDTLERGGEGETALDLSYDANLFLVGRKGDLEVPNSGKSEIWLSRGTNSLPHLALDRLGSQSYREEGIERRQGKGLYHRDAVRR